MTVYKVQDCGCIALPEELQRQTGLYPGATFQVEIAPDSTIVVLHSIGRTEPPASLHGAACKTPANRV